jgi:hypothetical protein
MSSTNPVYPILEKSFLIEWLFAFVLVVVARLPYLLSEHVFFDGDEAMLGIMGRDLITGKNIPFYFYGQQYGFSFFEALSAGAFILFLGSTVWSLKFGGMLLFSLGIQRLLKVLRTYQVPIAVFLLTTFVLVAFPTWVVWGTKLRGGYITAFVGVCFLIEFYLLHKEWDVRKCVAVSFISAIIIVSQSFFFLPVSLLLLSRFLKADRQLKLIASAVGIASIGLLRALATLNPDYWNPPMKLATDLTKIPRHFGEKLIPNFTGFFAFTDHYEVPEWVGYGAIAFLAILAIWIIQQLISAEPSSKISIVLVLFGGLLSSLALPFFVFDGGRYMLPFFTSLLVIIVFLVLKGNYAYIYLRSGFLVVSCLAIIPTLSGYNQFVSYWLEREEPDMKRLNELVDVLEERNLRYGFVSEWQLIWQLNYLGNDEMAFRYQTIAERVPSFVQEANACYLNPDCTPVLVGGLWPLLGMETVAGWNDSIEKVNARYYIMEEPDTVFLNKGGFELPAEY